MIISECKGTFGDLLRILPDLRLQYIGRQVPAGVRVRLEYRAMRPMVVFIGRKKVGEIKNAGAIDRNPAPVEASI